MLTVSTRPHQQAKNVCFSRSRRSKLRPKSARFFRYGMMEKRPWPSLILGIEISRDAINDSSEKPPSSANPLRSSSIPILARGETRRFFARVMEEDVKLPECQASRKLRVCCWLRGLGLNMLHTSGSGSPSATTSKLPWQPSATMVPSKSSAFFLLPMLIPRPVPSLLALSLPWRIPIPFPNPILSH